jgi:uncharacterized protein (DUF169 family)
MTDWTSIEAHLTNTLNLNNKPVAVTFLDMEPTGVERFKGSEPSGCSFWRLAAAGRTFYTVPADHYNCAVGSYTHHIELPSERAGELDEMLGLMTGVEYIRAEEIPGIPRLPRGPAAIVYSPLGNTPTDPDAVLFASQPRAAMLLNEAVLRAGALSQVPMLGRPACMALPAALKGGALSSLGCIGNRVFTDLGDDELYTVIKGSDVARVVESLDVIAKANEILSDYSRNRRCQLSIQ